MVWLYEIAVSYNPQGVPRTGAGLLPRVEQALTVSRQALTVS